MENLNSLSIAQIIIKKWKTFFMIMFFAGALAFAASFLIKEKYKSISVVYPINLFQNSEESSSEQLLQYFLSEDVKYKLAKEFDLFKRYGIDTMSTKGGKSLFNFMYQENVTVSPTIYESIEITIKDEDPRFAQKLNAALIFKTNDLIKDTKRGIVRQYLKNTRRVIDIQSKELDSISDAIQKIKTEYNIVDAKDQSKYLSKQLATGSSLNENSQQQVKGLREKGTTLKILEGRIKSTLKSYTEIKIKNDSYLLDASGDIDFYTYVSKPDLQDKKCSPVRWIIVVVSAISAFFMALVFFLYKSRSKDLL